MKDILTQTYTAIEYALFDKRVHKSVHAILRYIERSYKQDIVNIRLDCDRRWNLTKNKVRLTDTMFFKFLNKNYPKMVSRAISDLDYFVGNKTYNFVADDLQFVIRDATLITVYEV